MVTLPLAPESIDALFEKPEVLEVDFDSSVATSKINPKTCVVYLTNLNFEFKVGKINGYELKKQLLDAFVLSKFDTKSTELRHLVMWLLLRKKGLDAEESTEAMGKLLDGYSVPEWFETADQEQYLTDMSEELDLYCEYFDAVPMAMASLNENLSNMIKAAVVAGDLVEKSDDKIPTNIMLLAGVSGFIEIYNSYLPRETNVIFNHSAKAGKHLLAVICGREENSTLALLHVISNGEVIVPVEIEN